MEIGERHIAVGVGVNAADHSVDTMVGLTAIKPYRIGVVDDDLVGGEVRRVEWAHGVAAEVV